AGLAGSGGVTFFSGERIARIAVALRHTAGLLVAEAEPRDADLGDGDGDGLLALAPDELARRDVLPQVLTDLAPNDLTKTPVVLVDLHAELEDSRSGW